MKKACLLLVSIGSVFGRSAALATPPVEPPSSDESGTPKALFLIENPDTADFYRNVAAQTEGADVTIVEDVDTFAFTALDEAPWQLITVITGTLPAGARSGQAVDDYAELCGALAEQQGTLVVLLSEREAVPASGNPATLVPAVARGASPSRCLYYEGWLNSYHLAAEFEHKGRGLITEESGPELPSKLSQNTNAMTEVDAETRNRNLELLLHIGRKMNANRSALSATLAEVEGGPHGGVLGPPFCCGVIWTGCVSVTGRNECGAAFLLCFASIPPNPCHHYDGICSSPPGGVQFWLCDDTICQVFPCGGCNSGPANENCSGVAFAMGCTGGTCP